ncbi:hypothetical protein IIA79_05630, partial [bacterium]|nr:hypothetical protein [bacterium]
MARVQLLAGVIACTSALFPALAQAQNTAESPPPDQSKPAQGEPSTPENTGNIAESPPPDSEDAAGQNTAGGESASVPPDQGQAQPGAANAAEGRPVGGGVENRAEGSLERGAGTPDTGLRTPDSGLGSEVAEPPVPDFTLPSPTELAGPVEGYEAPGIKLNIVELEPLPARPPADTFVQPERHYLKDRPLPPLDVDETERERLARSIEESLKLLDLSRENRPEEGIRIPLPSGVLTFKASDAFQFDRRNGILTFTGNAEIIFGDIAIWADLIEVDDGAATAYAKGYVGVQQGDEVIYCDEAYVNYDTDTFELFYVDGNTGGPRLSGTLYFKAERAYGTFDRMILEKAEITTCAPLCGSVDEFHLSAHKVVYKSGSSIVLHDVYIYIRSHKVGY